MKLENMHWESEEKKKCRCECEKEMWEHVWDGCAKGVEDKRSWNENMMKMVGEDGQGEKWMKKWEKIRKQ